MILHEQKQLNEQHIWRAIGAYLPTNASKTGLLEETRLFLQALEQHGQVAAARKDLMNGGLPQRSRETRATIVTVIQHRLTRWSPPKWVYRDLIRFAQDSDEQLLRAALLLHVVRQDALLYDFVQHDLVSRWERGDHLLIRADVQRFLDQSLGNHPEIDAWSRETREKLAGNMLSILRDYGLLRGREPKHIVEPFVPAAVVTHLIQLLREEGIDNDAIHEHPDWQIYLWDTRRAHQAVMAFVAQENGE